MYSCTDRMSLESMQPSQDLYNEYQWEKITEQHSVNSIDEVLLPSTVQYENLILYPTRIWDYEDFNVVLNSNDAIIGRVMSDGVRVKLSSPLQSFKLCLRR